VHTRSVHRLFRGISLIGILAMTGCASGPTIRTSFDQSIDFTRFRTFGFFEPLATDRDGYQSLISQQLVAATERELVARGLQRTATNPDLLINFAANLDQRLRVTQTASPMGGFGSHRRGFYNTWPRYQQTQVRQYTKGSLTIDVVDAARRQLVWEGLVLHRITQRTMDNISPVIDSAVTDAFADFPLRPRKP